MLGMLRWIPRLAVAQKSKAPKKETFGLSENRKLHPKCRSEGI